MDPLSWIRREHWANFRNRILIKYVHYKWDAEKKVWFDWGEIQGWLLAVERHMEAQKCRQLIDWFIWGRGAVSPRNLREGWRFPWGTAWLTRALKARLKGGICRQQQGGSVRSWAGDGCNKIDVQIILSVESRMNWSRGNWWWGGWLASCWMTQGNAFWKMS